MADGEWVGPLRDEACPGELLSRVEGFRGHVWSVVTDEVRIPDGARAVRDVVVHPGAVGVASLGRKAGGALSVLPLFDCQAPALPWFAPAPAFIF